MERLEPVLKQKFWILLGVTILMTFIGWWMATAKMAEAITKRQTEIESAFKNAAISGEIPNESWAKRLGAINAEEDKTIRVTEYAMWKRQRDKMTWPEGVIENGYQEKFSNESRELFRDSYYDEVRRYWKMLNPLDENGNGIVKYDYPTLIRLMKQGPWPVSPPDSEVMWTIREDLWLLEGLFQTIAGINGGPEATRADACIHQIDRLELRGGGEKLKDLGSGGGGGGGGGGGMEGMMGGMPMPTGGPTGAGFPPGGGRGGNTIASGLAMVSAEFNAAEEFGDDGSASSAPAGGGGMGGSSSAMMSMMAGGGGDMPSPTAKVINRYIVDNPKFRTRGFYLSVKMDHTKIPLLIAELTANEKCVYPIEILRVQMSRLNEDDSNAPRSSGPGLGSSAMAMSMSRPMPMPLEGSSRAEEDGFNPIGAAGATPNSPHYAAAKSALENTLKDPVMAQVTICGFFTLYKKVDDPIPSAPASTTPAGTVPANSDLSSTDEPAAAEMKTSATDEPAADGDNPPTAAVMDADDAGAAKKPESTEPKTDSEPKTESEPKAVPEPKTVPEPKPDSSDK